VTSAVVAQKNRPFRAQSGKASIIDHNDPQALEAGVALKKKWVSGFECVSSA
jgi:hypothetical protein